MHRIGNSQRSRQDRTSSRECAAYWKSSMLCFSWAIAKMACMSSIASGLSLSHSVTRSTAFITMPSMISDCDSQSPEPHQKQNSAGLQTCVFLTCPDLSSQELDQARVHELRMFQVRRMRRRFHSVKFKIRDEFPHTLIEFKGHQPILTAPH